MEHPRHQLRAFERVAIPRGQAREVTLAIDKSDLSHWDEAARAFVQETGRIRLEIGASSADIRTETDYYPLLTKKKIPARH